MATRVALQLSGHLRETCDSDAKFAVLKESVASCRQHAHCDLFLHTWATLEADTPSWHRPNASAYDSRKSSRECAARITALLNVTSFQVEAQTPSARFSKATTWWTSKRGDSHISLAGIAAAIETQRKANDLRRAHELRGHRYDVVVRMRPDVYRADHPEVASWARIAHAPHNLSDTIFSCRSMRWPGEKGGDMCFLTFSPSSLERLYSAWEAVANTFLSAMECAWNAWKQRASCDRRWSRCAALGAASCAKTEKQHEFPENILRTALARAHMVARSWVTLRTTSPAVSFEPSYTCHSSTRAPGACLSKYTPCSMHAVTQQQCELLCEATEACRFYVFDRLDSQQHCSLLASRGDSGRNARSGELLCSKPRSHPTPSSASSGAQPPPALVLPGNTRRLTRPRRAEDEEQSRPLPLLALANPSSIGRYDGVRNGWSGWWLRLTSACDHYPSICTLWSADAALLPSPRCPVNCRLAPRPDAGVLKTADAVLMRSSTDEQLVVNASGVGEHGSSAAMRRSRVRYCIESEAGSWRMPKCPPSVLAVSTRPEAAMRFSWLSRYYLPPPLSKTNAAALLSQPDLERGQFRLDSWDGKAALMSVWFRHCHTDSHTSSNAKKASGGHMEDRASFLKQLRRAGLAYASYGRCGRNVPSNDRVLSADQSTWLANKVIGMRRHPFALVSENSAQPGWVTEKVYQALAAGVVPVWFGTPPGWEEKHLLPIVPPHSVVVANHWPSLTALVAFLRRAVNNTHLYERYHQWRHQSDLFKTSRTILAQELAIAVEATPCRICQALHSALGVRHG